MFGADNPPRALRAGGRPRPGPAALRLPAVVAALAAGATLAPLAADRSGGTPAPCAAEFQPDTLTIRDRPARVLADLPQDIGRPRGVEVPAGSGLQVREIRADADGRSWILGVFLGDATPGPWSLQLIGTDGSCRGTLTTRMPGLPESRLATPRATKT